MMHYPYKAEVLRKDRDSGDDVWWPVSSDSVDNMIVGDGIPGDLKTAEFGARCANRAYQQAIDDVLKIIKDSLPNERKLREQLLGTSR